MQTERRSRRTAALVSEDPGDQRYSVFVHGMEIAENVRSMAKFMCIEVQKHLVVVTKAHSWVTKKIKVIPTSRKLTKMT